jgi:hypothetical protein
VEGEFSEVRKKLREMCIEALRDAYGDLLCLLVLYRDTRPGIRGAEVSGVLVSQSTISGLGFSEGGNEHAGALGVSLTGRSFFSFQFTL